MDGQEAAVIFQLKKTLKPDLLVNTKRKLE